MDLDENIRDTVETPVTDLSAAIHDSPATATVRRRTSELHRGYFMRRVYVGKEPTGFEHCNPIPLFLGSDGWHALAESDPERTRKLTMDELRTYSDKNRYALVGPFKTAEDGSNENYVLYENPNSKQ